MLKYSSLPDHGQVNIYMDDNERKGIQLVVFFLVYIYFEAL